MARSRLMERQSRPSTVRVRVRVRFRVGVRVRVGSQSPALRREETDGT